MEAGKASSQNAPEGTMKRKARRKGSAAVLGLLLSLGEPPFAAVSLEGFGSSTAGGSQGVVIQVTSLEDSGPGTLRDALAQGNDVRIEFKVGGTIRLREMLSLHGKAQVVLDGSSAPVPGITLEGHALEIRGSTDVVVTHIRSRNSKDDGIRVNYGSRRVVIDHCSVTDAKDENIDLGEDVSDITVSWCIVGDTRAFSFFHKPKGMLIAHFKEPPATQISVHHNLFVNEYQRSPQVSTSGLFDLRNNVIQNWGLYGIRVRNGAWGNIVNNVFLPGSRSSRQPVIIVKDGPRAAGAVYMKGNLYSGGLAVDALSRTDKPHPTEPVATDPTHEVESKVKAGAGAHPRDPIDRQLAGP
jgi:pectate lyase